MSSLNFSNMGIGNSPLFRGVVGTNASVGVTMDDDSMDDSMLDIELVVKFIPAVIVFSVTFIFGIIGNVFVICTIIHYKRLHSITNIFLLSLATADLLLIAACVPLKFKEFFSYYWRLGQVLCKLMHYSQNVSLFSSVLHLTAISLERYIAIIYPFHAKVVCSKSRAIKIIVSIWIVSLIAASPLLFGKGIKKIGRAYQVEICTRVWYMPIFHQMFELFRSLIILFIPLTIMIFAYTRILIALKNPLPLGMRKSSYANRFNFNARRATLRNETTTATETPQTPQSAPMLVHSLSMSQVDYCESMQPPRQLVKMLIIIIVMFFVCWTPLVLNNLLVAFNYLPSGNVGILWYLRIYFSVLSYFNSCVNPIVYAFMSKNFRLGLISLFNDRIFNAKCQTQTETRQIENENAKYDVLNSVLIFS